MENYRWIKAVFTTKGSLADKEVLVRQEVEGSETFVDWAGNRFHISELDLTCSDYEPQLFNLDDFEKRNKEIERQYKENQAVYMEMLSKMDANTIADHKAKIDEREYWRNLRRDIFMKILERGGEFKRQEQLEWAIEQTERIFNRLYAQHQVFINKG